MTDAETKILVDAVYGKDKEAKVLRNLKIGQVNAKKKFLEKYPDADVSKFNFEVKLTDEGNIGSYETYFKLTEKDSFDITSDTFLNNKKWTKYLTSNKGKEKGDDKGFGIWYANGTVPKFQNTRFPNNPTRQQWEKHPIIDSTFQKPVNLGYALNNFKIYVTNTEYFVSNFPSISADWKEGKTVNEVTGLDIRKRPFNYKNEPYFAMICATYVATFLCGISTQHLTESEDVPKIITSMVRYHLYYQIRKFMKNPSLLNRYASQFRKPVKKYLPIKHIGDPSVTTDKDGNYFFSKGTVNYSTTDYKSLIAQSTTGLTQIGHKLLQQSVESYVYAVLGAQAKTRWSIVGEGAKSLQTQEVFHTIVEETIVQSDVTITISNMRTAIASTNVVLNMAISPGMILVPSNLIIQKEKIPGYNNVLTLATDKMKFGKNASVNYKAPSTNTNTVTKKSDAPKTTPSKNTNTVAPKTTPSTNTNTVAPKTTPSTNTNTVAPRPKEPITSVASEILGVTMMVGGFLFSKYIF